MRSRLLPGKFRHIPDEASLACAAWTHGSQVERLVAAAYERVRTFVTEHNVDDSHGLDHSEACVAWATRLLDAADAEAVGRPNASPADRVCHRERRMCLAAAALHDTCDHKYVADMDAATAALHAWATEHGFFPNECDALCGIVSTMPYSGLVRAQGPGYVAGDGEQPWLPTHGRWQRAYNIARHADLLDAYRVDRCATYTSLARCFAHMTAAEQVDEVRSLFERRTFRYVTDGWLTLPAALEAVPALEATARRDLSRLGEHDGSPPLPLQCHKISRS